MIHLHKYIIGSIISIAVIFTLISPGPVLGAGNTIVWVSGPAQGIVPGTQFTVNILVQPNDAIAGAQFNLSFNPSLVTVNSVAEGDLLKQNGTNTYFGSGQINNRVGTISGVFEVIIKPGRTVSTSGTLAIITLTAGSNTGTSQLNLSNVAVGDINGHPVAAISNNGQVSIGLNQSPILRAIGNKSVNEGADLNFTISATDLDGDALTYSASNLPSGASFNASTHIFSWTPTYNQSGRYSNVHFEVTDGSLTDFENITIIVNNHGNLRKKVKQFG
jgi:uncharacterized secreted protein with C-terminal beta-propeller domain